MRWKSVVHPLLFAESLVPFGALVSRPIIAFDVLHLSSVVVATKGKAKGNEADGAR